MYSKQKNRKAKAGLLLIASPRFKNLGEGLPHGTYGERKAMQVEEILGTLDFLDVIFPGIVYEREDAVRAMERFYLEKADFIIAEFLSWSEDFAWIRFLRDMPEVPMIFVNVAKERMAFRDTLDEDDFIEYLCSGTLVGSLEGSGSLPRIGRKHVRIVMGSREEVTRTHPDIRLRRPRTQPAAAIESRTAGQLQRGDVVHLFRSLRALHENRSGDPFPPLFDLRRGHRRRERHRTERILRRVDGPIPDDGRRRSRKIPGFGSRLDRTGGDGSHVRFRHFGLQ